MLYRTAGQFKTILCRRPRAVPGPAGCLAARRHPACSPSSSFPLTASEFAFSALLIPVLIYSLAALGLNILTGYAGQLSLGTGAFMGVGAYACYKLITHLPRPQSDRSRSSCRASSRPAIGVAFGLPSLRIKGFYLAIATLAAQFFLVWLFEKWAWLYNYNSSGAIQVPTVDMFGVTGLRARTPRRSCNIISCLAIVTVITMPRSTSRAAASAASGNRCATWTSPPNSSAST